MKGYTAVIDYGVGNLMSVTNAMTYLGLKTKITGDPKVIEGADAMILPGVGAFPDAAEKLRQSGMDRILKEQAAKKPLLGICLGMQLLFEMGEEIRPCAGLGLIPGKVERIKTERKLPHIGWNDLRVLKPLPLFQGLDSGCYVYFVHSYACMAADTEHRLAATDYDGDVLASVGYSHVYGCQFHPEKSGEVGLAILNNFGALI